MATEFEQIIEPLAISLLGEPNRAISSDREWRYGVRGSLAVDLQKGTWFDHEANEGGGALDLVTREKGLTGTARLEWLKNHGFIYDTIRTNGPAPARPLIVATYDYTDEGGGLLRQVVRYEPKDFKQRRPDGRGGWDHTVKGVPHVPYHLPQLLEHGDRVICIVEGEKDADRLWQIGVPATCNDGGAGKWRDELNEYFRGADVVIIPDRDPQKKHPKTGELMFHPDGRPILPGQDHAQMVAKALSDIATRVRMLELWKVWPEMPAKGDVSDWIAQGGTAEALYALIDNLPPWLPEPEPATEHEAPAKPIIAAPYVWVDPGKIPLRDWLYGRLMVRRYLSVTIAPGGVGKSSLIAGEALAMVSGRDLLGVKPARKLKVWLWNLEDPQEETTRKVQAAAKHFNLQAEDLQGRLFINSGRDYSLVIAKETRNSTIVLRPVVDNLGQQVREHGIDVLIIDPFVSCHEVSENDNSAIDMIAKEWSRVAELANCAIHLVHHTRKAPAGTEVTTDSSRGAKALTDAARVARALNQMSEEEGASAGVENHRLFFRGFNDKANLAPPVAASDWYRLASVYLDNGPEGGDSVGVVTHWDWPDPLTGITGADFDKVAAEVRRSDWRKDVRSSNWVGYAVAKALGLEVENKADKAKIAGLLKIWILAGSLVVVDGFDERRKPRQFVQVCDAE